MLLEAHDTGEEGAPTKADLLDSVKKIEKKSSQNKTYKRRA
jgi:hypothetical protein